MVWLKGLPLLAYRGEPDTFSASFPINVALVFSCSVQQTSCTIHLRRQYCSLPLAHKPTVPLILLYILQPHKLTTDTLYQSKKNKNKSVITAGGKIASHPHVFFLEMSLHLMHQIIKITSLLLFALAPALHPERSNINTIPHHRNARRNLFCAARLRREKRLERGILLPALYVSEYLRAHVVVSLHSLYSCKTAERSLFPRTLRKGSSFFAISRSKCPPLLREDLLAKEQGLLCPKPEPRCKHLLASGCRQWRKAEEGLNEYIRRDHKGSCWSADGGKMYRCAFI